MHVREGKKGGLCWPFRSKVWITVLSTNLQCAIFAFLEAIQLLPKCVSRPAYCSGQSLFECRKCCLGHCLCWGKEKMKLGSHSYDLPSRRELFSCAKHKHSLCPLFLRLAEPVHFFFSCSTFNVTSYGDILDLYKSFFPF